MGKKGSRRAQKLEPNWTSSPEFYQIRSNGSPLCRRCIQVKCDGSLLNSSFCFILKVPFDPQDRSGIVYVWIGSNADSEEAKIAENIVKDFYDAQMRKAILLSVKNAVIFVRMTLLMMIS